MYYRAITRVFRQPHTWAPFKASENAFRKIFNAVQVPPSFLNIVHTFGQPNGVHSCDLFGGYDLQFRYPLRTTGEPDRPLFGELKSISCVGI